MKHCPQCQFELPDADNQEQCQQCGAALILPKTIVGDSTSEDYSAISEIIVVEEFSIEGDFLEVESTQEGDQLETDLLLNDTAVSKQLSIDVATQFSDLGNAAAEPTISSGLQSLRSINLDIPDREISSEQEPTPQGGTSETDYELIKEVGRGAAGIVFSARQKSLDREVAIKMLAKQTEAKKALSSSGAGGGDRDVEKFLYESQITARLDHPNIIIVHDMGVTKDDKLFFSMKLLDGKDWFTSISANSLHQNLEIFDRVCDAMRYSHKLRIIHRDLKPQNVLVGQFGEVQVNDWGLAVDLNEVGPKSMVGGGTPCYMAPEMSRHFLAQTDAKKIRKKLTMTDDPQKLAEYRDKLRRLDQEEEHWARQIQEHSDVYVLGAILFQIAIGHPPHLFQLTDEMRNDWGGRAAKNKIRNELFMSARGTIASYKSRVDVDDVARLALREIAQNAMKLAPNERYADVGKLQEAVHGLSNLTMSLSASDRGSKELFRAQEDGGYQHFSNASHSFHEALELWPENKNALDGQAETTIQYAKRAYAKEDFELGLSLLTDKAIETVNDREEAKKLRRDIVGAKAKRERRNKMFWLATMVAGTLIAIAVPLTLLAVGQSIRAKNATEAAANAFAAEAKAVAAADKAKSAADKAKSDAVEAEKVKEIALEARKEADRLAVKATDDARTAQSKKVQAEREAAGAVKLADAAQRAEQQANVKAEEQRIIGKYRQFTIANQQEEFEFSSYLSSTAGVIGAIENLDVQQANQRLESIFGSSNIPLKLKNSWELHHLHKKANPQGVRLTADVQFQQVLTSASGKVMVALTAENQIGIIETPENGQGSCFRELINLKFEKVASIDLSADGGWVVVAPLASLDAGIESKLPVLFDMRSRRVYEIAPNVAQELVFESRAIDTEQLETEKFFYQCQYVKLVRIANDQVRLVTVDRRVERGVNVFRCASLPLKIVGDQLVKNENASVVKTKVAGQPFPFNPGLSGDTECLVDVQVSGNSVVVAIAASFPRHALCVFDLDKAARTAGAVSQMRARKQDLDFAPTAIRLVNNASGVKLLVGSGSGQIVRYSLQPTSDCAFESRKDFVFNGHRSSVKKILVSDGGRRLNSASKSEIIQWDLQTGDNLKQLFGHQGVIADLAVSKTAEGSRLTSFANFAGGTGSEVRIWQPQSTEHDPMTRQQFTRRIVTAAADKQPGSAATVTALDDGSLMYRNGSREIAIPNPARSSLPAIDLRTSRFGFFENRWLVVFSNKQGMLVWDTEDDDQVAPLRPSSEIFNAAGARKSGVQFSASKNGRLIVTSHPTQADRLVVWRRGDVAGSGYTTAQTAAFAKSGIGNSRLLNRNVQPVVSPGGDYVAVVVRLRNTFQIRVFAADSITSSGEVFASDAISNSKFRGLFFSEDGTHLIYAQENSAGSSASLSDRRKIVKVDLAGGAVQEDFQLPEEVDQLYDQVSIVDYDRQDGGRLLCVGSPKSAGVSAAVTDRDLIVCTTQEILNRRSIRFSRKLNPTLDGDHVICFESGGAATSILKYAIDNDRADKRWPVSIENGRSINQCRRAEANAVVAGKDSIAVYGLGDDGLQRRFNLSTINRAASVELVGGTVLVHHQDQTVSAIGISESEQVVSKQFAGRYRSASLDATGGRIAAIESRGTQMRVFDRERILKDVTEPASVVKAPDQELFAGVTWLSPTAVENLTGKPVADSTIDHLACISRKDGLLKFCLYNGRSGQSLGQMNLNTTRQAKRDGSIRSIEIARRSASLLGIVWQDSAESRCDIWQLTGGNDEDNAKNWAQVNTEAELGSSQIESLAIGQPQLPGPFSDTSSRIAIGTRAGGENEVKVCLVQMTNLSDHNAIRDDNQRELKAVSKVGDFEPIQRLLAVSFSGDGKTLNTVTRQEVVSWLSSGWAVEKRQSNSATVDEIFFDADEVEFLIKTLPVETELINELPTTESN